MKENNLHPSALMLFNESTKQQVIGKTRIADSVWKSCRGLMLESKENFDYCLIFELPRESRLGASIHMLFVFFPIDVVYLDAEKRVVDIKRGLRPFSLNYTPKKAAKYFIELPEGKSRGIRLGDVLNWA